MEPALQPERGRVRGLGLGVAALVLLLGCAEASVHCPRGVTGPCTVRSKSFLRRVVVDVDHDRICVDHRGVSGNAVAGGVALGGIVAGAAGAAAGGAAGLLSEGMKLAWGDEDLPSCRPVLEQR